MRPPYPRHFKYIKANSVEEALQYVEEGYRPLAGGQSISTLLKLGVVAHEGLVDIFELDELRYIREEEKLKIGALLTHNDVAMHETVVRWAPALSLAAWHIADLQVRNRGTIGGSLAHADPAANYPVVLAALNAEVAVRRKKGVYIYPISQFIKGPYETEAEDGLVVEIAVPKWSRQGVVVYKRRGASYPSLIIAVAAEEENGVVTKSRIAVGGLYTRPVVLEGALDGLTPAEAKDRAVKIAAEMPEGEPYDDPHMKYDEKRRLLPIFMSKALAQLSGRAEWTLPKKREVEKWRGSGGNSAWINGGEFIIDAEPRRLLIDFLREKGFKEVKRGCDEGRCGACTVLLDGRAVKSCTIFAVQAAGHRVETVRSLQRGGQLHPVQKAFLEEYAMQCGYCTHGFIMAAVDYLRIDPQARDDVLKLSVKNICRCTGYLNIIKAIKKASVYLQSK